MTLIRVLLIILFLCPSAYGAIKTADTATTTFSLPYWTRGDRSWDDRMNDGLASVDSILTIISNDVGSSVVTKVYEGVAGPLVVEPNTGTIYVSLVSADASTAGYIKAADFSTFEQDRVSTDTIQNYVSQDTIQNYVSQDTIQNYVSQDTIEHYVSTDAILTTLGMAGNFTLPTVDGNNGQVMKTDGAGGLSWASDAGASTSGVTTISADRATGIILSGTASGQAISEDVIISMTSADTSTAGYVIASDWNTWTNDRISTDSIQNYVSGDTIQNFVSQDAGYLSNVSTDAADIDLLSINGGYTFPTTAPTASGSVISLDSGNLVWGTIASSSSGKVLQLSNVQSGDVYSSSVTTPNDDTIPQISEGMEFMKLAFTPTSATSTLKIDVVVMGTASANDVQCVALYQDSTANALAAVQTQNNVAGNPRTVAFTHYMSSPGTSAYTFRVRAGSNSGTFTFNGMTGSRKLGGVMASSITIMEISS